MHDRFFETRPSPSLAPEGPVLSARLKNRRFWDNSGCAMQRLDEHRLDVDGKARFVPFERRIENTDQPRRFVC